MREKKTEKEGNNEGKDDAGIVRAADCPGRRREKTVRAATIRAAVRVAAALGSAALKSGLRR